MTERCRVSRNWYRLVYAVPLLLLYPPLFRTAVNNLTNFLNWTDRVFGWDWHSVAFAIMRWFDPSWRPGA